MNNMYIKSMNINIELHGTITSIIGPSNSGKTYLLKKICNMIKNDDIFIDDKCINNYDLNFLRNNIVVVLNDNYSHSNYVREELSYYLDKLGFSFKEIVKRINKISEYFSIEDMLDKRIDLLTVENKILIKILSLLIINPKLICIDDLFGYLNSDIINTLIKYIKGKKISLINVVSESKYLLLSKNTIVLNDFKALISTASKNIINNNSILPYIGINLPFAVDLSNNLMLYGVVDQVFLDSGKLVNKIWK